MQSLCLPYLPGLNGSRNNHFTCQAFEQMIFRTTTSNREGHQLVQKLIGIRILLNYYSVSLYFRFRFSIECHLAMEMVKLETLMIKIQSLFQNFNAWMGIGEEMLQQEIPRDTTYQDMDTTASCCIAVFSTLPSFQLFCVSENKGDNN